MRIFWVGVLAFLLMACAQRTPAMEFVHPGICFTKKQLDVIKTGYEQGQQPWKGYHDRTSGFRYHAMRGPFEVVQRAPDLNLSEWRSDMTAIFNLALLWYMEQDVDPVAARQAADRGISILNAWATTQKVGGGHEWGFELGDYYSVMIGAEILKSTYPGWTAADTVNAKWYFGDFFWGMTGIGSDYGGPTGWIDFRNWRRGAGALMGPANQGMLGMKQAMASAIFCDDEVHFREAVDAYMTSPDCALMDVAPCGEVGDTGRDWGHAGSQMELLMSTAEMLWCQGIDPYSAYDNRLRGAVEYFAHRQLYGFVLANRFGVTRAEVPSEPDFINFFPTYPTGWYWTELPPNGMDVRFADKIELTREVYKARGIAMPYADRYAQALGIRPETQVRAMDVSPEKLASVKAPAMWREPATSPLVKPGDLTMVHLAGSRGSGGVDAHGVWTLRNEVEENHVQGVQFAYRAMIGDCTLVARITSGEGYLLMTDRLDQARDRVHSRLELRPGIIYSGWSFGDPSKQAKQLQFTSPVIKPPYWLKLTRRGNYITNYVSVDGVNWACPANVLYEDGRVKETMYVGIVGDRNAPVTYADVSLGGTGRSSLVQSPQTIQAVPQSSSSVLVTWTPSPSGDECVFYDVLRYDGQGKQYWLATDLTGTAFTDASAPAGTTFSYRVAACGFAGRNLSRSPRAVVGAAPEHLAAVGGHGSVTLNWTANGAGSYRIRRSAASGGPYAIIGTSANTRYVDTGLTNGAINYYVVSSVTNGFEGVATQEVVGLPAMVTGIWAADPQTGFWGLGGNWVGGVAPSDGVALTFNASSITALNNDRPNLAPGVVVFSSNASAYSITGNQWLFNGLLVNASAQNQKFSTPISLAGDGVINAYERDVVWSGVVAGDHRLTKRGAGCLQLNAANTFTGGTVIKSGAVNVGNNQGFGSGMVTLDGGMLGNTAVVTMGNPITIVSSGGIALGSFSDLTLASPLAGGGSLWLGGNNANGVWSNHSLFLAGTADAFTGTITVAPSGTFVRFANALAGGTSATWAFNGSNYHTTLDFPSGTISFGAFTGAGHIAGNGPGDRTIAIGAKGSDDLFSGVIVDGNGTMSVTKTGSGTQSFSGNNTYTGMTTVSGGTLNLTGSLAGPVTVTSAAQLVGSGTVAGLASVEGGGIIAPGAGIATATLKLTSGLHLAKNSVLRMGIGMGATTDTIALSGGSFTPPAEGAVRVDMVEVASGAAGSHALVTGAHGIDAKQFVLGRVPKGYRAVLSAANDTLTLTLSVPPAPTGLAGTPVDSGMALRWVAPDDSVTGYVIYRADTPGSGAFTQVATIAAVTAYTDLYSHAMATLGLPYTYAVSAINASGEGPRSTSMTIEQPVYSHIWSSFAGTGSWNLGANWLGGGAPTSGQSLIFDASTVVTDLVNDCDDGFSVRGIAFPSGASAYKMTGNAISLSGAILGNSAANQVLTMPMALSGSCTAEIQSGSVVLEGVLNGSGSLRKTGDAALTMNGANSFAGGLIVQAGMVTIGNGSACGSGMITLSGGRIGNGAFMTLNNPIVVSTSGAIGLGAWANWNLNSAVSGSGSLILGGGFPAKASVFVGGSFARFTGTATVVQSTTAVRFTSVGSGSADAIWIFNNGLKGWTTLDFQGGDIPFGSFNGSGCIQGNGGSKVNTMMVGAKGLDDVFSGTIDDGGAVMALTKVGRGSLLLSGPSFYTGPTKVDAGTLVVSGILTRTSSVTVADGATLSGTGGVNTVTVLQKGGTIAPGMAARNGTLTLGGLKLSAGCTLSFDVGAKSDALAIEGTYVAPSDGKVAVVVTMGHGATAGSYALIGGAPGITASTFNLGSLPSGYTGSLSTSNNHLVLTLAPITPPGDGGGTNSSNDSGDGGSGGCGVGGTALSVMAMTFGLLRRRSSPHSPAAIIRGR